MAYPREEQETAVYDPVTDQWTVYSTLKRHITRLQRVGGEPIQKEVEGNRIIAGKWILGSKQVRFAKLFEPKGKDGDGDAVCRN